MNQSTNDKRRLSQTDTFSRSFSNIRGQTAVRSRTKTTNISAAVSDATAMKQTQATPDTRVNGGMKKLSLVTRCTGLACLGIIYGSLTWPNQNRAQKVWAMPSPLRPSRHEDRGLFLLTRPSSIVANFLTTAAHIYLFLLICFCYSSRILLRCPSSCTFLHNEKHRCLVPIS